MSGFLYKPIGQGQIGGGRATFLLEGTNIVSGGWYDKDGNLVERFSRAQGTPEAGQKPGVKFYASKPGGAYGQDLVARFTTSDGKVQTYNIANGGQRYEGSLGDPNSLKAVNKGPMGVPGQFTPGQVGQYGATPAYIGGMFPAAATAVFTPIQTAPYSFTDPIKFAKSFGEFNRGEIQKNFTLSQDLALKELGTELDSLKNFVPAASALKRNEVSIDNQFNQAQRTQQVNQALPHAAGDLEDQRERANAFASGNIPDSVQNSAFELGIRSAAADRSAAGGFGAASSVSRKASDLMSAAERVNLSKYGDQLVSSNLNQTASLFLAPTEYSNAGAQINVNPSVSVSQLIDRNIAQINGLASIPATQALGSQVQQNQFTTGLEQQTRQFNATGQFQASQFNANAQNEFSLSQFGYNAGYANSVAGAAQTDINTNFGLQQQQLYNQLMQNYMQQAQQSQQLQSILQGLGTLLGNGGITGITNSISGLASGENIGQNAGSLVGAGAGYYLGGPVGATIGSQIGSSVGGAVESGVSAIGEAVSSVS